ncbi:MAG: hypothetical protein M1816_000722 [Peltula sp. TS41687]|nr:MAG: hypothetical protein M1816_000722 [Peltula sp. TS41687]
MSYQVNLLTVPWADWRVDNVTSPSPMAAGNRMLKRMAPEVKPPPKLSAADENLPNGTIHVLGFATVGRFMAHCLAGGRKRPPITLITTKVQEWEDAGQAIRLDRGDVVYIRRGFKIEELPPWSPTSTSPDQTAKESFSKGGIRVDKPISQIIVATNYTNTVRALSRIQHRLHKQSTILFLQQGPGIIAEVNEHVFPDPETRPNYMLGFLTHTIYTRRPVPTIHAHGLGTTYLTTIPRDPSQTQSSHPYEDSTWSTLYLFHRLQTSPYVKPVVFPYLQFLVLQLERLAIRAVIGPLTAIFDCLNGELLDNGRIDRVMRLQISEISLVIRSLPELRGVPNLDTRFDPDRLETMIATVARTTSNHSSSMRQNTNDGNHLQIASTTGYIIRRGEELGIRCTMNFMIMQMALAKSLVVQQRNSRELPLR